MSDGDHEHGEEPGGRGWTFLTNHARVLICVARDANSRIRDIADEIGITERAAQLIIADLEQAGYLTRKRVGRRNSYSISPRQPFRHPAEGDHHVQELISLFVGHDQRQQDEDLS